MSAILGLLGLGAICAIDSVNKNAQSKKKCEQLRNQGAFLKRDYQRNDMLFQDYWMDWFAGEGEFVPKEYHAYFHRNPEAAKEYIAALTSAQLIREGLAPIYCIGLYNKNTYDAFGRFNSLYREKIKIFNETGKLYI